jgi:predicted lipid carrier protein YhbT
MLTALARSFQPRMAFGFQGEIQFEFIHIGDEHLRAADWWTIRVRSDRAVARRRIAEDPAVSLHISLPDFVRIVSGVVNPVTVWFENNVQIEGDVILGARLVELFGGVSPFEVLESAQRTG